MSSDKRRGHAGVCEACQPAVNSLLADFRKKGQERLDETAKVVATATAISMLEMAMSLPEPTEEHPRPVRTRGKKP